VGDPGGGEAGLVVGAATDGEAGGGDGQHGVQFPPPCGVDDGVGAGGDLIAVPVERIPTPDETRLLRLSPGVPAFRVLRTVYDSADRPVEVQVTIAAADRHQFRYEVDMR
jgi:hypothetical protein